MTLAELALTKEQGCQDKVVVWAADNCNMMLAEPPHHVDAAIWRVQAECNLLAAVLDAILAEIVCKDIAHNALILPLTTLPPPMAILSSSPHPTSYLGTV